MFTQHAGCNACPPPSPEPLTGGCFMSPHTWSERFDPLLTPRTFKGDALLTKALVFLPGQSISPGIRTDGTASPPFLSISLPIFYQIWMKCISSDSLTRLKLPYQVTFVSVGTCWSLCVCTKIDFVQWILWLSCVAHTKCHSLTSHWPWGITVQ